MSMKKIYILLLLLVMAILASCGETADTPTDTVSSEFEETTVTEITEPPLPEVLKSDYEGRTFKIIHPNWSLYNSYYFAEELNGDVMNDALFERFKNIEEALNIKMETYCPGYIDKIFPEVNKVVLAGLPDYDLALTHCISTLTTMAQQGILLNWHDIPVIDMDAPYWSDNARETFTINGRMYYNANDFILPDMNVLFFNKDMLNNYKLADPYSMTANGTWTWDVLLDQAKAVTVDINGDGTFDLNDQYGYVSDEGAAYNTQTLKSYGVNYVLVGSDGLPYLALDMDKINRVMDNIDELVKGGYTYAYGYSADTDPNQGGKPPLGVDSNQSLYSNVPLSYAELYRNTDVEFGILPMPKHDESQENYYVLNVSGFMCVPMTVADTELLGKVVELLGYYGQESIIPAFYDIVLNTKVSRDKESEGMLDIIFDNVVFDLGWNIEVSVQAYSTYNGNFTSYYEANLNKWNAVIEKIVTIYSE